MKRIAFARKYHTIGVLTAGTVSNTLIPSLWAWETLAQLQAVIGSIRYVNRDYKNEVAEKGDSVLVHRPASFLARQKTEGQAIILQDATTQKDYVTMNQHLHVAYPITDRMRASALPDLIKYFMAPAARAIKDGAAKVVTGEVYNFLPNVVGKIGLATSEADQAMRDLKQKFQTNYAPPDGRYLFEGPATDNVLSGVAQIVEQQMTGDGSPLITGITHRARGFNFVEDSFCPEISNTQGTAAVANAGGYPKGATSIVIDGYTGIIAAGTWVSIAGDGIPNKVLSTTETSSDTTTIVLANGLTRAVVNDAVISVAPTVTVSGGTYAANYVDKIAITASALPQEGTGICFAATADQPIYTIVRSYAVAGQKYVELNRPLEASKADGAAFLLPNGNYNLAMTSDAITLVNRPLPMPSGGGVNAFVAYDAEIGFAIRCMIGYDLTYMKDMVVLDTLLGVRTLQTDLGATFLT